MKQMRSDRLSYERIGLAMSPPISRERVRQILTKFCPELTGSGIVLRERQVFTCQHCGKVSPGSLERKFCSVECFGAHTRKYEKNPFKRGQRGYAAFSYAMRRKHNPELHKKIQDGVKRRAQWRRDHDPRFVELQNEAVRRYHERVRLDPVKRAELIRRSRERYQLIKADSEKYAARLAYHRAASKQLYIKMKSDPAKYAAFLAHRRGMYHRRKPR